MLKRPAGSPGSLVPSQVGRGRVDPRAPPVSRLSQGSFLLSLSLAAGLEELVLSEISSPSRSQPAGDSSSISSFSYKDMMKEPQTTTQSKVSQAYNSVLLCGTFSPLSYALSHFPAVFKVLFIIFSFSRV